MGQRAEFEGAPAAQRPEVGAQARRAVGIGAIVLQAVTLPSGVAVLLPPRAPCPR